MDEFVFNIFLNIKGMEESFEVAYIPHLLKCQTTCMTPWR